MAFELYSESYGKTLVSGYVQHALTRTYRGEVTTNLVVTCNDVSLPAIGSSVIIGGSTYWAISHQARRFNDTTGRLWAFVDVTYDNDANRFNRNSSGEPTTDPEAIAAQVQVQYQEYVDEITNAKLVRIENQNGTSMQIPPYLIEAQTTTGSVVNSAAKVIPGTQQRKHHKIITYWTYKRTWTASWETYIDDVNSAAFTITQSDSYGTRLQYSFAAKEARLADIIKEDHWFGDKLYFRRGLVIETKQGETWDREFPDEGHEMAIFKGQYNPFKLIFPNPLYTDAEIKALVGDGAQSDPTIGSWLILNDVSGISMTDPSPLNGWGAPAWVTRPGANPHLHNRYKLIYSCDDASDWPTALGVT